jgi:hypothetical protein
VRRCVSVLCLAALAVTVSAAPAGAKARSFTVIGVQSPNGTSTTATQNLFSGNRKVGHDQITCERGQVSICSTKFFFKTGTIRIQGRATNAKTFTFPIVGGKGAYKGAKGSVLVHVLSPTRERETFNFR